MIINVVDLALAFLQQFLLGSKQKLPAEVVAAVQSAVDALAAHKNDVISKASLEAQRG